MKVCIDCSRPLPDSEFYRKRGLLRAECRSCHASRKRRYKYWLEEEVYQEILEAQGNACGICRGDGGTRGLVVDHEHVSGRVRGILCHPCNTALGLLNDSPQALRRAIVWLDPFKPNVAEDAIHRARAGEV